MIGSKQYQLNSLLIYGLFDIILNSFNSYLLFIGNNVDAIVHPLHVSPSHGHGEVL